MLVIDIYAFINDPMAVMRQMSPENGSKQVFLRDKSKIQYTIMDIDHYLELIRVASRKKTKFHEYDSFEDLSPQMLADNMRLAKDGKLTISRVQAQYNYGYAKAMRIIEQLKEIGIQNYPRK